MTVYQPTSEDPRLSSPQRKALVQWAKARTAGSTRIAIDVAQPSMADALERKGLTLSRPGTKTVILNGRGQDLAFRLAARAKR